MTKGPTLHPAWVRVGPVVDSGRAGNTDDLRTYHAAMNHRTNWHEPWPWHITVWSTLMLGLMLRDEGSTGPAADPFWAFVGWSLVMVALLGLVGVLLWEFDRWRTGAR